MPAELIVHGALLIAVIGLLAAIVCAIPMIFYDLKRDLDYWVAEDTPKPQPFFDQALDLEWCDQLDRQDVRA